MDTVVARGDVSASLLSVHCIVMWPAAVVDSVNTVAASGVDADKSLTGTVKLTGDTMSPLVVTLEVTVEVTADDTDSVVNEEAGVGISSRTNINTVRQQDRDWVKDSWDRLRQTGQRMSEGHLTMETVVTDSDRQDREWVKDTSQWM